MDRSTIELATQYAGLAASEGLQLAVLRQSPGSLRIAASRVSLVSWLQMALGGRSRKSPTPRVKPNDTRTCSRSICWHHGPLVRRTHLLCPSELGLVDGICRRESVPAGIYRLLSGGHHYAQSVWIKVLRRGLIPHGCSDCQWL